VRNAKDEPVHTIFELRKSQNDCIQSGEKPDILLTSYFRRHQRKPLCRAFGVAKDLMLIKDEVRNARDEPVHLLDKERRTAVAAASGCEALYGVIKEDFWISTPCLSTLQPGDPPTFATSPLARSRIAVN
jgi:hypothetical protein